MPVHHRTTASSSARRLATVNADRGVHHLPQPAPDERGQRNSNSATTTGLPIGNYATMFFLRGPYNPASTTAGSNQTAQFCRQCHGGEANEMNGSTQSQPFSNLYACTGEGAITPSPFFSNQEVNI